MDDQIQMTSEAEQWLARTRRLRSPWRSKPVSDAPRWLLGRIGFWVARPGLDAAYQRQRLTLSRVRRAAATVATSRKRLELEVGKLERQVGELDGRGGNPAAAEARRTAEGRLAEVRRQFAGMQAKEQRVTAACRRLQTEIDAFRVGKAAIEAAYTAAEGAAEAVWAEVAGKADADAGGAGPAAGSGSAQSIGS
jgi:hypothetical protein